MHLASRSLARQQSHSRSRLLVCGIRTRIYRRELPETNSSQKTRGVSHDVLAVRACDKEPRVRRHLRVDSTNSRAGSGQLCANEGHESMGVQTVLSRILTRLRRRRRQPTHLPRCPSCLSERTASTLSSSPEVYSFRCSDCHHEWAQLIRTPMPHWSDPLA